MIVLLLACTTTPPEAPPDAPADPVARTTPPPSAVVIPEDVVASVFPAEIIVLNDTEDTLTFDRSFGPAAPLRIGAEGGRPLPVGAVFDDVDDSETGGWIQTCVCDCSLESVCPECEPPQEIKVTLAPGEQYSVPWNGTLRAYLLNNECATRFPVMAWPYVVTACDEAGRCARSEMTLPSSEPVVVKMSQSARADTCSDISTKALRRTGIEAWTSASRVLRDRPLNDCSPDPKCAEAGAIDNLLSGARQSACSIWVVPRGDRIETIVYLPLADEMLGGERYSHFFDPDATRILDVRYEQ